jgi:tagatose 6-phosphate kinase
MILVIGLSPAWQRTLEFLQEIRIGEVNRTRRVTETASGKGVNVARVVCRLGGESRLITVAGGLRGDRVVRALEKESFQSRIIRVAKETRPCQTLVTPGLRRAEACPPEADKASATQAGAATELVEETRQLTRREVAAVVAAFAAELPRAKFSVLSGSVPPGCGDAFYARLARASRRAGVPVLLDAQGAQLVNAIREKPFLVKVNRAEFAAATGRDCDSAAQLRAAVRQWLASGATWVAISQGPKSVALFGETEEWVVMPPVVAAANPIGSGDAMMAGIAVALGRGQTVVEAVRFGVACGAASALTATSVEVRRPDVMRLLRRVAIRRA